MNEEALAHWWLLRKKHTYIAYFMALFSFVVERLIRLMQTVLSKCIHVFGPDVNQDILEYGAGI